MTSLYMKHRLLSSNGTAEWHMHQMLNDTTVFEPDVLKMVETREDQVAVCSCRFSCTLDRPLAHFLYTDLATW